jgi:Flp pilus assembly protein TadG
MILFPAHDNACGAQRGETLVEFSLSLTVLLMTLLGTMEFGLAVFRYNIVSDLAQEGARYASVRGATSGGMKALEADVQTFVTSRALGISSTTSVFSVDPSTKACNIGTHVDPRDLYAGDGLCVQVQHNFSPFTRIIPLGNLTLSSTAQMIVSH